MEVISSSHSQPDTKERRGVSFAEILGLGVNVGSAYLSTHPGAAVSQETLHKPV